MSQVAAAALGAPRRRLDAADHRRARHASAEVVLLQARPLGGYFQLGRDLGACVVSALAGRTPYRHLRLFDRNAPRFMPNCGHTISFQTKNLGGKNDNNATPTCRSQLTPKAKRIGSPQPCCAVATVARRHGRDHDISLCGERNAPRPNRRFLPRPTEPLPLGPLPGSRYPDSHLESLKKAQGFRFGPDGFPGLRRHHGGWSAFATGFPMGGGTGLLPGWPLRAVQRHSQ